MRDRHTSPRDWVKPHASRWVFDDQLGPYRFGGAYLNLMSDPRRGCVYEPRKRLGDDACAFTAGYWAWAH